MRLDKSSAEGQVPRKIGSLNELFQGLRNGVPSDEIQDYEIDLKDIRDFFKRRTQGVDITKLGKEDVTVEGFVIKPSSSEATNLQKLLSLGSSLALIELLNNTGGGRTRSDKHTVAHAARPAAVRNKLGHTTGG